MPASTYIIEVVFSTIPKYTNFLMLITNIVASTVLPIYI